MTLKYLFALSLYICPLIASAQVLNELERRNGFKDLKLGMTVDSVKGIKLKKEFLERNEFNAKLYTIDNPHYEKIGEVSVNRVEVKAYQNQIYQIHVVADKDPRLMKALESIYGLANYDMKRETYFWKAPSLILKFRSYSRNQLEMIYTSLVMLERMKIDKQQKVNDIADDF